jgi:hypothetical protein
VAKLNDVTNHTCNMRMAAVKQFPASARTDGMQTVADAIVTIASTIASIVDDTPDRITTVRLAAR